MFILGTRGTTHVIEDGAFHCPHCGDVRPYMRKKVKNSLALFLIPVLPLEDVGEYVECVDCEARFDPGVLTTHSVEGPTRVVRDVLRSACVAFAHIASPNEVLDADHAAAYARLIQKLFAGEGNLAGLELQIRRVRHDYASLREALRGAEAGMDESGKEALVRFAVRAGMELRGGPLSPASREAMKEVGELIGLSSAHIRGILVEAEEAQAR